MNELKKLVKQGYYDALKCAEKNNDDISNTINWNYFWEQNESKFKNLFLPDVSSMYGNLKTNFQTSDIGNEEIYLGDELKVIEGTNCLNRGIVVLEYGEFKINGETLEGFLDCEWTIVRSGKNDLINKLTKS